MPKRPHTSGNIPRNKGRLGIIRNSPCRPPPARPTVSCATPLMTSVRKITLRPPPRKLPILRHTTSAGIDPILNAAILWTPQDKERREKSKQGFELSQEIRRAGPGSPKLYDVPTNISGLLNRQKFSDALDIYENNQQYYRARLEQGEDVGCNLTALEHWFICVFESMPKTSKEEQKAWFTRERSKNTGYSPYCDPLLKKYINPPSPFVRGKVREFLALISSFYPGPSSLPEAM